MTAQQQIVDRLAEINDATGYANDGRHDSAEQVRAYFTVASMRGMGLDRPDRHDEDVYWQQDLDDMAALVIQERSHMIGEVERLDETTVIVHTGHYGQHDLIEFEVTAERSEDEDGSWWDITLTETREEHMAGGGIRNRNVLGDPYVERYATEPTAGDLHTLAVEAADEAEHGLRSRARDNDES